MDFTFGEILKNTYRVDENTIVTALPVTTDQALDLLTSDGLNTIDAASIMADLYLNPDSVLCKQSVDIFNAKMEIKVVYYSQAASTYVYGFITTSL